MVSTAAKDRGWQCLLGDGQTLRRGTPDDHRAVTWLLGMSRWSYQGHPRQSVLDMLGEEPSFVLCRGERLRGVVLCSAFRHPVAMVEAMAARGRRDADMLFGDPMDCVEAQLAEDGVRWLGVAGPPEWVSARLAHRGYSLKHQVVPLRKEGFDSPLGNQDVVIRGAEFADLPAVLRVDHGAFEPFWQMNAAVLEEFLASSGCFLVAEHESQIVGYVDVDVWQNWAHVNRVAVLPEWQGMGIGMQLMHDALDRVGSPQRRGVRLNTQTDNERSLQMYARLGFLPLGVAEQYWAKPVGPETKT